MSRATEEETHAKGLRRRGRWLPLAGCGVPGLRASFRGSQLPSGAKRCRSFTPSKVLCKTDNAIHSIVAPKMSLRIKDKSTISEEDLSVPTRMTLVEGDIVFPLKIGLAARGRCWQHADRYPHTVCHQGAASGHNREEAAPRSSVSPYARPPTKDRPSPVV